VSHAKNIDRVVRRLEASSGRRIARRNALRALDALLRRIRRELRKKYPSVGKDGAPIERVKLKRGERRCPHDGAYVPTPGALATHVLKHHDGKCICGFQPRMSARNHEEVVNESRYLGRIRTGLTRHFGIHKDNLTSHLVWGAAKTLGAKP